MARLNRARLIPNQSVMMAGLADSKGSRQAVAMLAHRGPQQGNGSRHDGRQSLFRDGFDTPGVPAAASSTYTSVHIIFAVREFSKLQE